ncbi:MAG: tetratricopeptide repeat protein [Flavobacterium sp.]|nr:tetratricopeptide repeat protein [Flavobacterium sp.]
MNALKEYKEVSEKLIILSKEENDSTSLAKAYSYLGDYYTTKLISEKGFYCYFQAEKIYKNLKDDEKVAKTLLNKGILQNNESDYVGSEKSILDALKYLRKSDDDVIKYEANNVLGVIYNDLSEFDKALEYHNKALEIADQNTVFAAYQAKATSLNNIGYVYKSMNNYPKAIAYYKNALKEKNIFYDKTFLYAILEDNLAYSKFKIKDFNGLPNLFFDALKIRDSLKIIPGIIASKLNLSEYYAFKKDSIKAFYFAEGAYSESKLNNRPKDVLLSLKQLSEINPKNAISYSKEYIRINDSLQLAERKIRNKLARIEFETDEIITQKNQLIEQRKSLIYITLGIILLAVLIFVIRFQAAKNRELKLVQEQQKANEEIYQLMLNQQNKIEEVRQLEKKRIAQELHDGVLGKLFGTRMNLGVLNRKRDEGAEDERDVYIDELKTLEQEIREISHDLNTEKTAVFNNFVLMVNNFIATQRKVCQAEISFSIDESITWNRVDNMAKINLYRILQEAFQNINKHANAKRVNVTFTEFEGLIKLIVEDNGVGFLYARKKKGIGMLNMKARITDSQGTMQVETEPGEGTILKFELPLNQP